MPFAPLLWAPLTNDYLVYATRAVEHGVCRIAAIVTLPQQCCRSSWQLRKLLL